MRKFLTLLACWLLATNTAFAAIALVTHGTASGNAPSATGLNTTGSTLFTACVAADAGQGSGQTVSDNKGNTWTRIVLVPANAVNQIELWYSLPTTVGASTNITYSGNFSGIRFSAFSGTATSSVLDGSNTSNKGNFITTVQPGSITPSQANGLLVTCFGEDANTTAVSIDSSFTITDNVISGAGGKGASAYLVQTSASAVNPTWSGFASTTALSAMQAFKDPGGGSTAGGANPTIISVSTP